ncbi:MAG: riboflavin biosynthesis protein RibF [Lachnospiraceae bacterium]|jgi:riboflavin kinase/FMN adenylyltransferase|nr:riboflavin biosynthesis protein RibF [Lachnospiraceae bacterium]
MVVYYNHENLQISAPTAVALGKFDGVHLGHRHLLAEVLQKKQDGLQAAVLTFDPPPEVYFGRGEAGQLLTNPEKEAVLAALGFDMLVYFPLDETTAAMEPEAFVSEVLLKRMQMRFICAGGDLRFGAGGRGDSAALRRLAEARGFGFDVIPKLCHAGREISSTYVREAVMRGDMSLVAELLGTHYLLSGIVEEGARLGRTLGFATANLATPAGKVLPPRGVYASTVLCRGGEYAAVTNIGEKPTVSGTGRVVIESHLFDFDGDLYGERLEVRLREFKRPERKFASVDELAAQIEEDVRACRDAIACLSPAAPSESARA